MFKISILDLIEEVKAEIVGYEELGEEKALEWEKKFRAIVEQPKYKKAHIKESNGEKHFELKDESDVFAMADNYFASIEANEEEKYWNSFR